MGGLSAGEENPEKRAGDKSLFFELNEKDK